MSARALFATPSACLVTACLVLACGGPPVAPDGPAIAPPTASPDAATPPVPVASAGAPAPSTPPPEPSAPAFKNVIVLTVDAMRADMPWNGYPRDIAPNMTALAKKGVSYSRAYALSSYTAMSMGGFLGGRYPGELARSGYFFSGYPDEEQLFPEALQKHGVTTIAAHAHFYFDDTSGFRQGFDIFEMVPGIIRDAKTDNSVTSPQHVELAIDTLKKGAAKGEPFFAWYHFMDPHDKYRKHEGYKQFGPKNRDRYDGEIYFTDHHLGTLLKFIESQPWGKHTAIVVSSDHGEGFGEKNMTRHGFELWDHLVHVPLIVYYPGIEARKIDELRSHIDLTPTIFDLLGKPKPDFVRGRSLLAEIEGKQKAEAGEVIVDLPRTSHNWRRRALIRGRYKIIAFGDDFRFELYDILDDPTEQRDLRHVKKDVFSDMKARYLEKVKGIHDVCPKMRHKLKGKRPGAKC
jgi:choline-sulfatase